MLAIRKFSLSLAAAALFIGSTVRAQIQNVTDTTSTPTPGVGHDYIHMLNETVNPANGSISLRISVPIAPGRKLTLPFAFAYDSNGIHHFVPVGSGFTWLSNKGFMSQGGWTYTVPMMSADTGQQVFSPDGGQTNYICDFTTDYMFQDASGGRHALSLSYILDDYSQCSSFPSPPQSYLTGGDDFFGAALTSGTRDLSVTDADGTVYSIPWANQNESGGNPNTTTFYGLPPTIKDRNGNIAKITDNGHGAFTVTDTLGRTGITSSGFGATGNTVTIAGLSSPYTLTWGTASTNFTPGHNIVHADLPCSGPPQDSETQAVVTAITLPNGKQYQFFYDGTYGLLNKIVYPTGGYVSYAWGFDPLSEGGNFVLSSTQGPYGCDFTYDTPAVVHRYVSFDGSTIALQQDFSYSTSYPSGSTNWTTKQTTVTTHDNVRGTSWQTVYNYGFIYSTAAPNAGYVDSNQIPLEQTIVYKNTNGSTPSTLRTVTKAWFDAYLLGCELTTLDNGLITGTWNAYGALGQLTDRKEYDYGLISSATTCQSNSGTVPPPSGITPTRETAIAYQSFPNIFDRPSSLKIYGNGTRVTETDYSYDQFGTATASTPAGTHDETNYGPSSSTPRGNATTITKQCFPSCSNPVTTYTYDETGQTLTVKDPCGNGACNDMPGAPSHTTNYSYSDSYSSCGGSAPPSGNTNAFLTQIIDPLGRTVKFCYGYTDGQLRGSTDPNNQTTTYKYNDSLARLTETDFPDTGKTTISYNDAQSSITTCRLVSSGQCLTTIATLDGVGHVIKVLVTPDPDCSSGDRTDTTYDALGRVYTVSNPYCSTSDSTYGLRTYMYDPLSRTTQVTNPDTSTVLTTYTGRATQVQDEGNGTQRVARISQSDGLGHLTSVCEVSNASLIGSGGTPAACGLDIAGTGFLSTYQYDALDDLLQVNQSGIAPRTFAYDSLSRLTSAGNPESGTTSYSYDANGNVATKTDARNITITHTYNALNQLTGKTYSDGTPAVTFTYDETSARGVALTNTKGRLSSERTAGSLQTGAIFSYDPMGRIADNSQCTPQNCGTGVFALQYPQYDFLGDLISGTNAAGVTFTYSYNGAARLTGITTNFVDPSHPGTLFSQATYNAPGLLKTVLLGNGLTETRNYNSRLQLTSLTAGTAYSLSMGSYAPNGDVLGANDSVNGNWVYKYDDFNRLICSNLAINGTCSAPTSGTATYSYKYDRFGNRWQQNGPQPFIATFTGNNPRNPQNNNRMDGYSYDAAGNLLNDGIHNYSYDAENRISKVDNGTTASYVYDAEGRRVRKATASGTLDFLYDAQGHKVAEVDTTGTFQRGELYAGDRHFAVYAPDPGPSGAAFFIHTDWLRTERARTNMTGAACETIKSLPFGDGQTITDSCGDSAGDVSPMHFTGKERDSESGLDNFETRYFGSSLGRFMSPGEPLVGQYVSEPQSWDAYAYVRNNAINATDPDGQDCVYVNDDKTYYNTGNCIPGMNGTYVNGTIDPKSASYDPNTGTLSFNYTNSDTGTIGKGVIGNVYPSGGVSDADRLNALSRAGNMAAPGVNLAAAGLRAFGYAVGGPLLPLAECIAGAPECSKGSLALALIPGLPELKLIGLGAKEERQVAGTLKQIADGTNKGREYLNSNGLLPLKPAGYYREYTVSVAGQIGRGVSRVVTGLGGEIYYTAMHSYHFIQIK